MALCRLSFQTLFKHCSNIVLNNLDWELEKRNLRFARYADDCIAFVGSQAAGERVMKSLQRFLGESLQLTVNTRKSAVGRPWERSFLGFTFSRRGLKIKVSDKALPNRYFRNLGLPELAAR